MVRPMTPARALVVDDSAASRRLLRSILSSMGFKISTAMDGRAAWELHAGRPFDVIVTDWVMPNMDGYELVRALRTSGDTTPVLVVSGYRDGETRDLCTRFEKVAWLGKPLDLAELRSSLRSILRPSPHARPKPASS